MCSEKQCIRGTELLSTHWHTGDLITYNSEPEDIENEELHINDGEIENIFENNENKNVICIRLAYGKIIIPLNKITIHFSNMYKNIKSKNDIHSIFVYGIFRDDCGNKLSTKWIGNNCRIQDGRLYKYRLLKRRDENYPFAMKTINKYDYINGRIITWSDSNIFHQKLHEMDKINGDYCETNNENIYERNIVKILNENGEWEEAIFYYRIRISISELEYCEEVPDGDWSKRYLICDEKEKDIENLNTIQLLKNELIVMLKTMEHKQDELIDCIPLPDVENENNNQSQYDYECFSFSGSDIAVMNGYKMIKKFRSQVHSVFGKYIVNGAENNNNIYKWTFKIENGGNGLMVIGIILLKQINVNIMQFVNKPFYKCNIFDNYGYNVFNGYKISQNRFEKYCIQSKTNDIIDMELNMKNETLIYYINGKCQNIAFENIKKGKDISYQMAVSVQKHQDSLSLQQFEIIKQC